MSNQEETRENTPSLKDRLTEKLHDWIDQMGPRIHGSSFHIAEIKFSIFTSETMYLDDDTPFIDAKIEESMHIEEIGGWIGEPRKESEG